MASLTREELIEKAQRKWAEWSAEADKCVFVDKRTGWECVADFILPLLAAEREQTIEECAQIAAVHWGDPENVPAILRALKRAPEKLEPGAPLVGSRDLADKHQRRQDLPAVQAASSAETQRREAVAQGAERTPGTPPAPSSPSLRKRAEELLDEHHADPKTMRLFREYTIDAMLAFGEEREASARRETAASRETWLRNGHAAGRRAAFEEAARLARGRGPGWGMFADELSAASRSGADKEQPEAKLQTDAALAVEKGHSARESGDQPSLSPPALSPAAQAEILERAADIMERELAPVRGGIITGNKPMVPPSALHVVKSLRATSKLLRARPAAEPDWAEAVALEWFNRYQQRGIIHTAALAALLRERFGPLVEALEWYTVRSEFTARGMEAIATLRAGARGERK